MLTRKKKLKYLILIVIVICSIKYSNVFERKNRQSVEPEEIIFTEQIRMQDIFSQDTNGYARGICIAGDYAYVAVDTYGLAIIDISDPTNPGTPVYKDTSGNARSVFVAGDYAFVADMSSGLAIIDISDPSIPGSIFYETTTGNAYDVQISGDYAYVADGESGLAVINITDPTNPGPTYYKDTPGNMNGVHVEGDFAFVTDKYLSFDVSSIKSYNISDPMVPLLGDIRAMDPLFVSSVFIAGDFAYVAAGSKDLAILDISVPDDIYGDPVAFSDGSGGDSYDVFVSGDYAYVATDTSGLAIIDISDPANPGIPVYANTPGNARGVCVEGNYAYIGDGNNGLVIIQIGEIIDPGPPIYESFTNANAVQVVGDYAYVAATGLAVVDISDPTNPGPQYNVIGDSCSSLYVSGNIAYLTDIDNNLLRVVNISDPTNPTSLSSEVLLAYVYDIFVEGDFAYVSFSDGLSIVNISNPLDPQWIGIKYLDHGSGLGVNVEGNYAYIAARESGLAVIDISDPLIPSSLYYEDTSGLANDVYIEGDYAYIADDTYGLAIIDISNPTNPGAPVYRSTSGSANGVWVSGDYAYVSVDSSGLAVIDISNPTNPGAPVYRDTSNAMGVCVEGDYAYIADFNDGLVIMKIMNPWYILEAPILESIPPGPYYDGLIDLNWDDIIGATKYYVYRGYSPITTLNGRSPIATEIESVYQDIVYSNTTYYYAVVAANDRGNSFLSNFRFVTVTIDNNDPKSFSIISPTGWITNQTPTVIAKFYVDLSGVDVSTVQYAYSNDGNLNPNNWAAITGVYYNEECLNSAFDRAIGWLYAKVENVQFNKDSSTDNIIRFRASDMVGNQGTQATASVIQIDITKPGSFSLYSPTILIADQTPTVIAKFYTSTSGVNISTVEYAYSTSGEPDPINWAPVDGVYGDSSCLTPAYDNDTGWLYTKVNEVSFNQDSTAENTIRFRATDIAGNPSSEGTAEIIQIDSIGAILFSIYSPANEVDDQTPTVIIKFFISGSGIDVSTVEYACSTSGELAPINWLLVDGVYTDAECNSEDLVSDGTTGWLFAKVNAVPFNNYSLTENTIRLRAKDMLGNQGTQENAAIIPIVKEVGGDNVFGTIIAFSILSIIGGLVIFITAREIIKYRAKIIIKSPKKIGKFSILTKGIKGYLEFTRDKNGGCNVILRSPTAVNNPIPIPILIDDNEINRIMQKTQNFTGLTTISKDKEKKKLSKESEINILTSMGKSLYKQFFPKEIQKQLSTSKYRILEMGLGSGLLQFPWELFHDGETFLGLKYSIGRIIIEENQKLQIPYYDRGSKNKVKFLIIGDPAPEIEGKVYTLPGALNEANQLNETLSKIKHVNTISLIREEANIDNVKEELEKDYDFIHYCGHSYFDIKDPNKSGLHLNDGILRATTIASILNREQPPILAFINGCKSGKEHIWTELKYENQVSGLASSFLLNGINYIGSLWSVHDKVAIETAESFYFEVLRNVSFGESLRRARLYVHETLKENQLGWAPYILYGDPTYTLEKE